MNTKILMTLAVAGVALVAIPVSAQTAVETRTNLRVELRDKAMEARIGASTTMENREERREVMETRMEEVKANMTLKLSARAGDEIEKRIESLNALSVRISKMERVSTTSQAQLSAQIDTQINELNVLKAKIASATSTENLRFDVKAVTQMHRVYGLIVPQIQLLASADRLTFITTNMTTIGTKLQTRIDAAKTAGEDTVAVQAQLSAYTAKVAEASAHAQAAITATASLTPDNGDDAKVQANRTAMKNAREEIRLGRKAFLCPLSVCMGPTVYLWFN